MRRPSRLELLKYALEGAQTLRGVYAGAMDEEEEDELDAHIDWLVSAVAQKKQALTFKESE